MAFSGVSIYWAPWLVLIHLKACIRARAYDDTVVECLECNMPLA